ncbi:retinoid-inducible serine carboxypeptidase [Limosa lapponica baueri]|uniref:Retinoid-inducible serine carboxypeptidase n=1 Tax=Limosa lapponica baueri TaxID=1758121 RepID=A0A2I0TSB8_LIMLA|nr:retinoid-inducible serine carboxypeptidase [Limosa lapponica baueri]
MRNKSFSNTDNVNFYNIMTKEVPEMTSNEQENLHLRLYQRHVKNMHKESLNELMNGPIREKLKIIPDCVKWGGQSRDVFENMAEDFMKPVVDIVDQLLAANVNVTVYNGQLDLIVDTMGQEAWIRKLKWPNLDQFNQQRWKALYVSPESTETAAFHKAYENFAFFWILKAGHMDSKRQQEKNICVLRQDGNLGALLHCHVMSVILTVSLQTSWLQPAFETVRLLLITISPTANVVH